MKKVYSLAIAIILISGLFWGCQKKGNPPTLPPAESMAINFSEFVTSMKSGLISNDTKAVENTNWTVAATVAGFWNALLVVNLAVPVAAFEKAINNKPTYLDNKTWQWKYSVNVVAATYTARLTGQVRSGDIKWQMFISKDGVGGYAEFLWFEGTTASDGTNGIWTINASQTDQNPFLQIDWFKSNSAIDSVKYTYIKTGEAFNGSYIKYGLNSNLFKSFYNAFYNVYLWEPIKLKFTSVNIEWSTSSFIGRIQASDYFQDNNWYCWDANGNDGTCPAK
jgi:hypothetical protein